MPVWHGLSVPTDGHVLMLAPTSAGKSQILSSMIGALTSGMVPRAPRPVLPDSDVPQPPSGPPPASPSGRRDRRGFDVWI